MSDKFIDGIYICVYCGGIQEGMTERQIKVFGKPHCCDFDMLQIERDKIHTIVRAIDNLRKNLEEELLKGVDI